MGSLLLCKDQKLMSLVLIRKHLIPLLIATILVMPQIMGDAAFDLFCYDRSAINDGQLWRLLSGHFIHLSWSHLGLNMAGLLLLWLLVRAWVTPKELLLTIFFSGLIISLCLLALNREILQYAGFSGILHGIWVVGALAGISARRGEAYFLMAILISKLAWEQLSGPLPTPVKMSGNFIAVDAHLYGAIAGLMVASLMLHRNKRPDWTENR